MEIREAAQSAINTFGPGPEGLTAREWKDAVAKLQAAIATPARCEAAPVGGFSAGWQCDLPANHGNKHMALILWQHYLEEQPVTETIMPINWETQQ